MSKQRQTQTDKTIAGRSMLEMIGVVALMSIVVAGALLAMPSIFKRNRANVLYDELSRRAVALTNSPVMEKATAAGAHVVIPGIDGDEDPEHFSASEFNYAQRRYWNCREDGSHVDEDGIPHPGVTRRFIITAMRVSREDCQQWSEMVQASRTLYPRPVAARYQGQSENPNLADIGACASINNLNLNRLCGLNDYNAKEMGFLSVAYPIERQALGRVAFNPPIPHEDGRSCEPAEVGVTCGEGRCCMPDPISGHHVCQADTYEYNYCAEHGDFDVVHVGGGTCYRAVETLCDYDEVIVDGTCQSCPPNKVRSVSPDTCTCVCNAGEHLVADPADPNKCQCESGYYENNEHSCIWCQPTGGYLVEEVEWNPETKKCQCKEANGYVAINATINEPSDCLFCPTKEVTLGGIKFGPWAALNYAYVLNGKYCMCKTGSPVQFKKEGTKTVPYCDCPLGTYKNTDIDWSTEIYRSAMQNVYCGVCNTNEDCPNDEVCISLRGGGMTTDDCQFFYNCSKMSGDSVKAGRISIDGNKKLVLRVPGIGKLTSRQGYEKVCDIKCELYGACHDLPSDLRAEASSVLASLCDGSFFGAVPDVYFAENENDMEGMIESAAKVCVSSCSDGDCTCEAGEVPFVAYNNKHFDVYCAIPPKMCDNPVNIASTNPDGKLTHWSFAFESAKFAEKTCGSKACTSGKYCKENVCVDIPNKQKITWGGSERTILTLKETETPKQAVEVAEETKKYPDYGKLYNNLVTALNNPSDMPVNLTDLKTNLTGNHTWIAMYSKLKDAFQKISTENEYCLLGTNLTSCGGGVLFITEIDNPNKTITLECHPWGTEQQVCDNPVRIASPPKWKAPFKRLQTQQCGEKNCNPGFYCNKDNTCSLAPEETTITWNGEIQKILVVRPELLNGDFINVYNTLKQASKDPADELLINLYDKLANEDTREYFVLSVKDKTQEEAKNLLNSAVGQELCGSQDITTCSGGTVPVITGIDVDNKSITMTCMPFTEPTQSATWCTPRSANAASGDSCFAEGGTFAEMDETIWGEYIGCNPQSGDLPDQVKQNNGCGCFGGATYTGSEESLVCGECPSGQQYLPNITEDTYTPNACSGNSLTPNVINYSLYNVNATNNMKYAGTFGCSTFDTFKNSVFSKSKRGYWLRRCTFSETDTKNKTPSLDYMKLETAFKEGAKHLYDYFTPDSKTVATSKSYLKGIAFVSTGTISKDEAKSLCWSVNTGRLLENYNDYTTGKMGSAACSNKRAVDLALRNTGSGVTAKTKVWYDTGDCGYVLTNPKRLRTTSETCTDKERAVCLVTYSGNCCAGVLVDDDAAACSLNPCPKNQFPINISDNSCVPRNSNKDLYCSENLGDKEYFCIRKPGDGSHWTNIKSYLKYQLCTKQGGNNCGGFSSNSTDYQKFLNVTASNANPKDFCIKSSSGNYTCTYDGAACKSSNDLYNQALILQKMGTQSKLADCLYNVLDTSDTSGN